MKQALQSMYKSILTGLMAVLALGMAAPSMAAPPAAHSTAALQAQQKDVDARLAAARTRHAALQAQVTQQEQQNAAQHKQLQQRDAEIATLQQKLRAAGVPASALSSAPASH